MHSILIIYSVLEVLWTCSNKVHHLYNNEVYFTLLFLINVLRFSVWVVMPTLYYRGSYGLCLQLSWSQGNHAIIGPELIYDPILMFRGIISIYVDATFHSFIKIDFHFQHEIGHCGLNYILIGRPQWLANLCDDFSSKTKFIMKCMTRKLSLGYIYLPNFHIKQSFGYYYMYLQFKFYSIQVLSKWCNMKNKDKILVISKAIWCL